MLFTLPFSVGLGHFVYLSFRHFWKVWAQSQSHGSNGILINQKTNLNGELRYWEFTVLFNTCILDCRSSLYSGLVTPTVTSIKLNLNAGMNVAAMRLVDWTFHYSQESLKLHIKIKHEYVTFTWYKYRNLPNSIGYRFQFLSLLNQFQHWWSDICKCLEVHYLIFVLMDGHPQNLDSNHSCLSFHYFYIFFPY